MARFADSLITLGLMFFGLVLMATPLALWVAWTDSLLIAVLAAGIAAGVLYCVLVRFKRPADQAQGKWADRDWGGNLPDKTVDELQSLHPFVHHHRPSGGPRFRAAMYRLKKRLY